MTEKARNIIAAVLALIGTSFILIMAFGLVPDMSDKLLFAGVLCFVFAGAIKGIKKA